MSFIMEEHINPTILDNFENNCESMDIKRTNQQGVLRGVVESANLQFMNIHSRDQEFIDHTLLGPEYIGNTISNSFMIDLMDEEQHDPSGQGSTDCPIAALGSNESFPSEAQLHTILQFVNRQGHIRNQPSINIVESSNDHLIHHSDKEIIESEFLALHGNLLNDQNFKLFCSQQIIPIQEGISTDLNITPLQSLPTTSALPITNTTWLKKDTYKEHLEETPELLGPLGLTAKKVLPHKKRISKKLKNLDKDKDEGSNNYDQTISPESPPRVNRFVVSNGSHYECELCGSISETQVQFFSHLKGHYEPSTVEGTESPTQRVPTTSIVTVVDKPVLEKSESPSAAVVEDHQVFNEVELNFDNFNEVVELTAQEHHHQHHHENVPNSTDMKIIDSNSIEECMEYVVQAQEPTQVVCNVHEEVEFSDTEDMLEGIRGVVDKVSIDDTSNDLDMHPRDISKESWFTNSAFNGITFKEEMIPNEDFERRSELRPISSHGTDDDRKMPINSSEFKNEEFSDNTHGAGSSELNYSKNVQENSNVKRRGRPRSVATKKIPKIPHTDDDDESSQEFLENNKRRYICSKCNREFNSCNALKYHNLSHTGERPHQCEVCGKSFYAQSALKSHMRLHTGDKPYECEECHRKFRQWSDLKYHIVSIHSDVKNYTCEFCGKSFSRKYSLVIHRRIHTSERNYKCEFCPKSFRASSYLQNHRKIHTGEKPYTCTTCGKKFRVGGDLRRHSKTHERKAPNESKNTNVEGPLHVQSKHTNINKLAEIAGDLKNDVLLKIDYQKESKDDLLFLDKMASKINHLFKTEEDFVDEDLENSDLSFVT